MFRLVVMGFSFWNFAFCVCEESVTLETAFRNICLKHIVANLLKESTLKSADTAVAKERLCKHTQ
jgi:hypothetical protein